MSNILKRLEERQTKLNEQIKAAKADKTKKETAIYAARCKMIGEAVLAEMEENSNFADMINPIIDARTTQPITRKKYGLAPLRTKETNTNDGNDDKPAEQPRKKLFG